MLLNLLSGSRKSAGFAPRGVRLLSNLAERKAAEESHKKTYGIWKGVSVLCIPAMGAAYYMAFGTEHEHIEERKPYPHLRIRTKPFPWGNGDTPLFPNEHTGENPEKKYFDGIEEEPQPSFLASFVMGKYEQFKKNRDESNQDMKDIVKEREDLALRLRRFEDPAHSYPLFTTKDYPEKTNIKTWVGY
eukprot:Nk52_evm43s156 gene=Nk52_evmTU43s156